jgi:transaldolase
VDIFLDSMDVEKIREYSSLIVGITTNPTMARRFNMKNDVDMIKQVRKVLDGGEIHVEAFGETSEKIIKYANNLLNKTNDKNLVFKIPFGLEGVIASKKLVETNIKTNLHLIFSVNQALIAASVKSTYICPLVGRLDDIGHNAMENLKDMIDAFKINGESTKIMVSSVRHPQHVKRAYMLGADAITIPLTTMEKIFYHPLTTSGIDIFKRDIEVIKPLSTVKINSNLVVDISDTIQHCLSLMVKYKSGAVAVKSGGYLAGIFTVGDLKRIIGEGKKFDITSSVKKFMRENPIVVNIDEPVMKAIELFKEFGINELIVTDGEVVIGILDSKDVK